MISSARFGNHSPVTARAGSWVSLNKFDSSIRFTGVLQLICPETLGRNCPEKQKHQPDIRIPPVQAREGIQQRGTLIPDVMIVFDDHLLDQFDLSTANQIGQNPVFRSFYVELQEIDHVSHEVGQLSTLDLNTLADHSRIVSTHKHRSRN